MARSFAAQPATLDEVPLLIGIIGPPGGGKTWSSLRLATGMQRVRPGPIVLIDTERGRASKYAKDFNFLRVPFDPPFVPADFLAAVKEQLPLNPAAIIIDSLSDEHEGEGGVLEWHDRDVPKMGGNEWAAWSKPKASRRTMINGFLQIKVPLIFTFRAREKTKQMKNDRGRDTPVNIGYQPIAPNEIVYALDMTCILPPKAEGVPIWHSDKIGEDFIIKLPNYLKPFVVDGKPLCEDMGAAFATWAKGGTAAPSVTLDKPADGAVPTAAAYVEQWRGIMMAATRADQLGKTWNEQKYLRDKILWPDDGTFDGLRAKVMSAIESLKAPA
jgi:hypothetical protein